MKAVSGVYWDKGGRESNQDSLLLQQVMTHRGRVLLAAVSDGIGSLPQGEQASGFIMEKLSEHFYRQLVQLAAGRRGKRALARSVNRCLYEICTELNRYAGGRGIKLGATISVLLIWRRNYLTVHLGDSRIYSFCRNKERQLTTDHSDGRHGLMKCLGSFPYQCPEVKTGRIWGRMGFLLCTDGFSGKLEDLWGEALRPRDIHLEEQISRRLGALAQAALKQGEKDNLSALYVMVYKGGL